MLLKSSNPFDKRLISFSIVAFVASVNPRTSPSISTTSLMQQLKKKLNVYQKD
jgi:hypothetical protein